MKTEIYIIIVSICLILGLSFFVFNFQKLNLTGFVGKSNINGILDKSLNESIITKEMTLQAINESEQIIKEMQEHNFSILYMNDTLIEAKRAFRQAEYAEMLRGEINATEEEKSEARKALSLIKWEEISYADVLFYTEDIKARKEKAFLLIDEIVLEESKINPKEGELYSEALFSPGEEVSEETKQILENAKIAFQEDRYQDAENLLEEFRVALEQEKAELSTLSGIKKGAKNFFQRYWIHIIIALILLSAIGYFTYKKFEKRLTKKKIRKMKAEKEVLINLMKKVQLERFEENKISGLVYNIRMKKYQERLQEIKQELPVLEARLYSHPLTK